MSNSTAYRYLLVILLFCYSLSIHAQTATSRNQSLPIVFEQNLGQVSTSYGYHFHRDGVDTLFTRNGMDVVFRGNGEHPLHIEFVGGNATPRGMRPLTGHANYLLGSDSSRWVRNVPLFSEVDYTDLYRGVSLGFYGNSRELEHDFRVDPGADPSQIVLRVKGTSCLSLQPDGDLAIDSLAGTKVIFRKPVAYQMSSNGRESVQVAFRLAKDGVIRFQVGAYDHSRSLVIDPVIVFATYLAGTGNDEIAAVTTDAGGNILVTGFTTSLDFPTKGAVQSASGGSTDAFITKLDSTGKTLIYSTYLGGSSEDYGGAITVDSSGNAIVAGVSTSSNFPHAGSISAGGCQTNQNCYFLASLKPDGSALNYCGLIGNSSQGGYPNGVNGRVAVDAAGNAYLAGVTDSPSFYVTPGTLASTVTGYPYSEMFVLKVDPTGNLVYSTVVPGNAANNPLQVYNNEFLTTGISVDGSGNVTAVGWGGLGLPTTSGVVAPTFPNASVNVEGPSAGFVLQLNPTASAINFASYLPGTDRAGGLAIDSGGNLWIAGTTSETNLPVSANAYQKAPSVSGTSGPWSGYIMKVAPNATSVLAATYLDGTGVGQTEESSSFTSIALDSKSNVFVGGMTSSTDFPLQDPFVTTLEYDSSTSDMILAEMSPDLSTVEFGSFLSSTDLLSGGSNFAGMAIDAQDHLIAAGTTNSSHFPTTPGSFEPQLPPPASPLSSPPHSFIAKIDLSVPAPAVCFDTHSVNFGKVNANTSTSKTIHVTNCGNAALNIDTVTSSDPTVTVAQSCGSLAAGAVCPVQLTFTPVSSLATSGSITFSTNAVTLPQTVSFAGQGIAPKIVPAANPFSFGHLFVGTQGPAVSLSIMNQGQVPLSISNVSVSGSSFSLVGQTCTQAPSTNFCVIQLSFAPVSAGALTGALTIASNDPVTPQLVVTLTGTGDCLYAIPSISSISAPTVLINNGTVTETITGINFYPQSVAQLNGVSLSTTFVSNTALKAAIPASLLTGLGEQNLLVVNPGPGGGSSPGIVVTPYQTLLIDPAFIISVPATGLIYAAIPSSATSNPNTVIPIDPATGATQTPIPVGKNPALLAASSDGSYLYVANQTDQTVQRINLKTNAVERTFPYTPNLYCSTCTNLSATDLATIPGSPQEVLLSQGSWLTLFNDAGLVNYVPNDGICCYADPNFGSIALAGNPLAIYALPFVITGKSFQVANLTSSGLAYTRLSETNYGGNTTTGSQVISDGTLLYTSAGQIWDPSSETEVGTFPVTTFNATSYPNDRSINLDVSLGEIYSVGEQDLGGTDAVVVSAYGMKSHTLDGTLIFPQMNYPVETDLVRWGTNGLAFIGPGAGLTDQEVYLMRSSVVSPSAPNPTPVLSAISPASLIAGGSSFVVTVNGSNFLASSVIDWNGAALTTTFVSSQQLTATVPSSSISQTGTAQIAVYTPAPGGGSSSSANLAIAPAKPIATLSVSQLSFANTVQGVASSAQTIVLTNSGTATLTISSITANGDFAATNACGSGLAPGNACNIAVVYTPSTVGTVTGTVSIADNASNSPQTIALTGTGLAAMAITAAQGGATSATVSSGGTATYNLSIAAAAGFSGIVNLACTGAPQYSTCSVTPSTVNLASGTTTSFVVTVKTTTTQAEAGASSENWRLAGIFFGPLFSICWLVRKKPRSWVLYSLCFVVVMLTAGISGCAGSGGSGSSPIACRG